MLKHSKIYVAGHTGLVGSAVVRLLKQEGYTNIITRSSSELDLRNQSAVDSFFEEEKAEYVFLAAAKVGGINANNTMRGTFLYDNLMINANVIEASKKHGINKLVFLGSSCIYPKFAPQPIKEEALLGGALEPTNEPYAIAKIAGIKLCESYRDQYGCNFISTIPTNLYGPNDNYDLENSHVLPALMQKIHTSKTKGLPTVEIWGDGSPMREFLHVDDLAKACLFLMLNYNDKEPVNIGSSEELSIRELAEFICATVGYTGELAFNSDKPNGVPRKLVDSSKINTLGWKPEIELVDGIKSVYSDFLKKVSE
ncbi:MAG: GDP-L-fucose synthase [Crocinitomicaceae bacterium]|jgi:GDP-L-fucose synthase